LYRFMRIIHLYPHHITIFKLCSEVLKHGWMEFVGLSVLCIPGVIKGLLSERLLNNDYLFIFYLFTNKMDRYSNSDILYGISRKDDSGFDYMYKDIS